MSITVNSKMAYWKKALYEYHFSKSCAYVSTVDALLATTLVSDQL